MRSFFVLLFLSLFTFSAFAAETMKMNYKNAEISDILEDYSKASGQRFIMDPNIKGKISILNTQPVSLEEAFSQISSALAINGVAFTKEGDGLTVRQARMAQRGLIETGNELPTLRPEKMFTWVVTLKHISAEEVLRHVRTLSSKDGEMTILPGTNQLIFTDWVSSLHHVRDVLQQLDKPVGNETAKIVATAKKARLEREKNEKGEQKPKFRSEN